MDSGATITISGAVVALTQFSKWAGIPDKYGPIAVMLLSLFGVALWGWSAGTFTQAQAFAYFTSWINVTIGAAGIFGFTRAASSSLTAIKEPPPGAGASATTKMGG